MSHCFPQNPSHKLVPKTYQSLSQKPTKHMKTLSFGGGQFARSNFNTRKLSTRVALYFFGHSFLGCGSYDLGIWQDFSPMSPLPS